MSFTEKDLETINQAITQIASGKVIKSVEAGEDKIEYKITSIEDLFRLKSLIKNSLEPNSSDTDSCVQLYLDSNL